MKNNFFVIKNFKRKICLFSLAILVIISIIILKNLNASKQSIISLPEEIKVEQKEVIVSEVKQKEETKQIQQRPDDIPENLEDYTVIAKIEIPKIDLVTYLLNETNEKSMNVSVTKLCGPEVNKVGNLCITGHNYNKPRMFGKLKKLECGDKIYIKDLNGIILEYEVYDIFKIKPDELECLSQETNGEREITLITCTTGAIKRLIVKAVEVYD